MPSGVAVRVRPRLPQFKEHPMQSSPEGDRQSEQSIAQIQLLRWQSPIVNLVLGGFSIGIVSGLILYFTQPFIGEMPVTGTLHWGISLLIFTPYCWFQLKHYRSNRDKSDRLHFKVGLWTFFSICAMLISGLPMILDSLRGEASGTVITLAHIFASFVFIMLVCGHLILVFRVTQDRVKNSGLAKVSATRVLMKPLVWVPLLSTALLVTLMWLLSR